MSNEAKYLSKQAERWLSFSYSNREFYEASQKSAYHPQTNPKGIVNLCTSQNLLVWDDWLLDRFKEQSQMDRIDPRYGKPEGTDGLRQAVSRFYKALFRSKHHGPEQIVVGSGVTDLLARLVAVLANPGDAVLVEAPYFSHFKRHVRAFAEAELKTYSRQVAPGGADLVDATETSETSSVKALSRALEECKAAGQRVAAVLLCSPHNPLGRVYDKEDLKDVVQLCKEEGVSLVVDEIYAGSTFEPDTYTSCSEFFDQYDHIHVLYGLAKDFGLAGCKVGFLLTQQQEVLNVMRRQAVYHPVSGLAQTLVEPILSDISWVERYFVDTRTRLKSAYAQVIDALDTWGIYHEPVSAGLVMALKQPAANFEEEKAMQEYLFKEARVYLGAGQDFGFLNPGWFRLCFSTEPETLKEGLRRLSRYLKISEKCDL